jgi:hypothetical protein
MKVFILFREPPAEIGDDYLWMNIGGKSGFLPDSAQLVLYIHPVTILDTQFLGRIGMDSDNRVILVFP